MVSRADVGGDAGDAVGCAGFAFGMLVLAAERGFDLAGADAGPAGAVEVREDSAADVAGQVAVWPGDAGSGGDEVLRCLDGDLVAGTVRVGTGHGLLREEGLVDGEARTVIALDSSYTGPCKRVTRAT